MHPKPTRSFVHVSASGKTSGRYLSKTPSGAARKIGNRLLKKKEGQKSIKVRVMETTQGSQKKIYTYVVMRMKLPKSKVVHLNNGQRVSYKFKTVVKSKN